MANLIKVDTSAGDPRMHPRAASRFNKLRRTVSENSGVDFLAKCGDVLRPANYRSTKDGVADRSWHKTGRAFDYDQTSKALVIVSEPVGGKQYFRTWLICKDQTGKQGFKKHLRDYRGGSTNAYVFDFTAAAQAVGFKRIPAWAGWRNNYNRREFWHYQFDEGLTWAAAMAQLISDSVPSSLKNVYGLNDRGTKVIEIQSALFAAGLLKHEEIDGVFGAKTEAAVIKFQKNNKLEADGEVGPETLKALQI